ncbi:MAG: T9SS type A sorting domain-containing protein, partial [Saprospiraceae bacterium]
SNPTACLPCNGKGKADNSSWWAFVANGGEQSITVTFSGCHNPNGGIPGGIEMGLSSSCDCTEQIACVTNCSGNGGLITMEVKLIPCKIYYLWVDGCNGDICNFTIVTKSFHIDLLPLGKISRANPKTLCKGCCDDFWIQDPMNPCPLNYEWTIDGSPIQGNAEKVNICFPDEGTFSVCVLGYTLNPSSGNICSQTNTVCTTVNIDNATATQNIDEQSIHIIPNPNDGNFIIYLNESIQYLGLQLMTSDGKEVDVLTLKQSKNQIQVQTGQIPPGIYQLNVKTNKGMISKSVVIF